jgi:hypothetical protein
MATVTDKRKVLSVEEKLKVIRDVENEKKGGLLVSGIWFRKFYNPKDL